MACGAPAASVHGDVYAGRVVDCEEAFERRDFLIADMDSNAPWVALAKEVNGRRAAGGAGAAEARRGTTRARARVTPIDARARVPPP